MKDLQLYIYLLIVGFSAYLAYHFLMNNNFTYGFLCILLVILNGRMLFKNIKDGRKKA